MASAERRGNRRLVHARAILAAALMTTLAACSTPTPYRAADGSQTGYSEQRIETDRYRVSFTGNDATSLDTVRNYALYRAAELTVAAGYDHFTVVSRSTESLGSVSSPQIGVGVGGGSGGSGVGIGLSTFLGGPSGSYGVFMDVLMGSGPEPAGDDAYDAREVLKNLGPTLVRPTESG